MVNNGDIQSPIIDQPLLFIVAILGCPAVIKLQKFVKRVLLLLVYCIIGLPCEGLETCPCLQGSTAAHRLCFSLFTNQDIALYIAVVLNLFLMMYPL